MQLFFRKLEGSGPEDPAVLEEALRYYYDDLEGK